MKSWRTLLRFVIISKMQSTEDETYGAYFLIFARRTNGEKVCVSSIFVINIING